VFLIVIAEESGRIVRIKVGFWKPRRLLERGTAGAQKNNRQQNDAFHGKFLFRCAGWKIRRAKTPFSVACEKTYSLYRP
jgi:hypothetical protein